LRSPTNSYASFTVPDSLTVEASDILSIEIDPATRTSDLFSVGLTGTGSLTIQPGATLDVLTLGSLANLGEPIFNIHLGLADPAPPEELPSLTFLAVSFLALVLDPPTDHQKRLQRAVPAGTCTRDC